MSYMMTSCIGLGKDGFDEVTPTTIEKFLPKFRRVQIGGINGYPYFSTFCETTPEEILEAKKRLVKAALRWSNTYRNKVVKLQKQLAQENRHD